MMRWTAAALAALSWHCCLAAPAGGEGFAPSRTIAEAVQRYEAARAQVEAELGVVVANDFHRSGFSLPAGAPAGTVKP